ncbi:uncharacterized protein LOC135379053 isoform X2 [Ornithodoros turicata]|uniref:uncharacterized protein LOC135379053 isoform X2 n=1 Tax=Ornithodoros turicata TaxID=34597 RepID=UPI00313A39C6
MNTFSYVYHYVGYFIATHVVHEHGPPTSFHYPESFPELQNYQDAWAFLNNTARMALLYRTFRTEENCPGGSRCAWMKRVEANESEKTFLGEVSFYCNDRRRSMNLTLQAMTLEGYNVSTFFSLTKQPGAAKTYHPVVYQEPGKCAIIRRPHKDTEMQYACDLWVSLSTLEKNKHTAPKRCIIMYDYLCGTTKHKMFGEDCINKTRENGEITSSTEPTGATTATSA